APDDFWSRGFDYLELLDSFAAAFGKDRIVVRPYHANRRTKYLLHDFISVIAPGLKISGLSFNACLDRLNLRDLTRIDARFRAGNRAVLEKYRVKIATRTSRRLLRELLCSVGLN